MDTTPSIVTLIGSRVGNTSDVVRQIQEAFEKGSGLLLEGMATAWVASEATIKAPILVIEEYIWKIYRVVDGVDLLL